METTVTMTSRGGWPIAGLLLAAAMTTACMNQRATPPDATASRSASPLPGTGAAPMPMAAPAREGAARLGPMEPVALSAVSPSAPRPASPAPTVKSAATGGSAGPAVLRAPVASQCRERIEKEVELDSGNRVILGDGAFATSDRLVLERIRHTDAQGRLLDGRARPEPPLVYVLRSRGQHCSLLRAEGDADARASMVDLPDCECDPVSTATHQ